MRRHRRLIQLAVLCLIPVLLGGCASAIRDRRVLIMNFESSVPGSPQYSTQLAEIMTACMANAPRVGVLDRQDLGWLLSRTTGPKALRWQDIGRKATADYVIVGSISRLDQNYLINARLLSVKTGEIVKGSAVSRYAKREEDIYPSVQAICYVLSYQLKYLAEMYDAKARGEKITPPPPEPAASTAPTPAPPVVLAAKTPAASTPLPPPPAAPAGSGAPGVPSTPIKK